jgi:hypothetical protein
MKRYIMFTGDTYYPNPGWYGFAKDYKTIKEIKEDLSNNFVKNYDWWHVVDLRTGEIVMGAGSAYSTGYVNCDINNS